jgi:hypothetical protein
VVWFARARAGAARPCTCRCGAGRIRGAGRGRAEGAAGRGGAGARGCRWAVRSGAQLSRDRGSARWPRPPSACGSLGGGSRPSVQKKPHPLPTRSVTSARLSACQLGFMSMPPARSSRSRARWASRRATSSSPRRSSLAKWRGKRAHLVFMYPLRFAPLLLRRTQRLSLACGPPRMSAPCLPARPRACRPQASLRVATLVRVCARRQPNRSVKPKLSLNATLSSKAPTKPSGVSAGLSLDL